jgi:hypothetical protein
MKSFTSKSLLFTNRVILFAVYVSFFIVQSVKNFSSDYSSQTKVSFNSLKAGAIKKFVSSAKAKDSQKSNIRLNKRFHPESITSISYSLDEPFYLLSAKTISTKPQDHLLISSLLRDSLRGPPVAS